MTADVVAMLLAMRTAPSSEPPLWFTCDPPCVCGRPRSTMRDVRRWISGVSSGEIQSIGMSAQIRRDPEWARRICWTIMGSRYSDVGIRYSDERCLMKPIDPFTAMR